MKLKQRNTNKLSAKLISFLPILKVGIDELYDEIKKMGVPTANFSCNNTHQFYLTKEIAPYYDFNLHSEKSAGEKFTEIGAKPVWFQMAANPKYYHPVKIEFKYDVGF